MGPTLKMQQVVREVVQQSLSTLLLGAAVAPPKGPAGAAVRGGFKVPLRFEDLPQYTEVFRCACSCACACVCAGCAHVAWGVRAQLCRWCAREGGVVKGFAPASPRKVFAGVGVCSRCAPGCRILRVSCGMGVAAPSTQP